MTLQQVVADLATKNAALLALVGGPDKVMTTEELTQFNALEPEVKALRAQAVQLKAVEDARTEATKTATDLNTVKTRPSFGGGEPETKTDGVVEFPFNEGLKNFRGATLAEANQKAYRAGKWLHGHLFVNHPGSAKARQWCEEHGMKASQAEGTIQDGGALVPPEFERTLIDLREQYGSFRPNAKREPMMAETKTIPRRTGGLTAYFIGENAPGTTSSKAFDQVTLVAKKIMCLVPYSTEIAEDAMINLADDLAGEIAYAFAKKEDDCGFNGDGTSTYGTIRGVIQSLLPGVSATIASVAGIRVQGTISTGTFASATLGDFQNVIAKLPKYADGPRAKWYMHKTFFHGVCGALMVANAGNRIMDLQGGIGPGNTTTFLGYPVEFCQVLPTTWVASTIYALFGDLTLAASFGDRRGTTLFTDPYSLSANDQIQIRGTERFDIVIHDVGSTTVPGPITAFASAAS